MVTSTRDRVPLNTDACINASIRRKTENNIAYYASGGADAITRRLAELDQESLDRLIGRSVPLEAVAETVSSHFGEVFDRVVRYTNTAR